MLRSFGVPALDLWKNSLRYKNGIVCGASLACARWVITIDRTAGCGVMASPNRRRVALASFGSRFNDDMFTDEAGKRSIVFEFPT